MHQIQTTIPSCPVEKRATLVENRQVFNLVHGELNLFESFTEAHKVPLLFSDLVVTSMLKGKKVMHLPNKPAFDYLPGESVVVNPYEKMVIDFPLASEETPTQCMALAIDDQFVNQTLDYLNHYYSLDPDIHQPWQLINEQYHFKNDPFISQLVGKIIEIGIYQNRNELIFADFSMKELIVRILQNQNLLSHQGRQPARNQRLKEVTDYIDINLDQKIDMNRLFKVAGMSRCVFFKWFKQQVGLSPLEYIQTERIAKAKKLLQTNGHTVSDVAFECGFQDVNYFVRAFRLNEGVTPGQYQKQVVQIAG